MGARKSVHAFSEPNTMKAVIFDIDGTLANCDHRLHHLDGERKDWDSFFASQSLDAPIESITWLNRMLGVARNEMVADEQFEILIVTARPSTYEDETERWLIEHDVLLDRLYMRAEGDYRPDNIVKAELLDQILQDGYEPYLVIDDRPQVVEMWRSFGITTLQCAPDEPVRNNYEGQTLLHMLIGPAGAGKTSYCAKNYFAHDVISTDAVREQYGWGHHPDELARTWKYVHGVIKVRLENGMKTVLDATNLKFKDRKKVLSLVPRGQLVQYVIIDRDYDEKIKDRGWRPIELIDKHHKLMKSIVKDVLEADGQGNILVLDARK